MALAEDLDQPASGISDRLLELAIGMVVIVLAVGVWTYTHFGTKNTNHDKPKPAWLSMPKVMAQMADGRMVNVKINLRLAQDEDVGVLEPHIPAFTAAVQETGTQMSRDDLKDREGMIHFGLAVKTSINGYLKAQDVHPRVKDIAFEEMTLLP